MALERNIIGGFVMEKKYQCKLWAKELIGDNTCRWVSGVVVRDREVVITTSPVPVSISKDLAEVAAEVFSKAKNVTKYQYEISQKVRSEETKEESGNA